MHLKMHKINKYFGPVQVLFDVDFEVNENEFHALIGENGAGKSTLVKILTGIENRSSGDITVNDVPVIFRNVLDAEKIGIYIVNQELNLFPEMTVLENLFICKEPLKKGFIDEAEEKKQALEVFKRLDMNVDMNKPVKFYSVGVQQLIEIAKSLLGEAKLIILDEPTSALSSREISILFSTLRILKEEGKSIIYISHRLPEVFELCDSLSILRDGHFVLREFIENLNFDKVIKGMVGYELGNLFPNKPDVKLGSLLLEAKNVTRAGEFSDISFTLRAGEIIGFAGLIGAGRTELMNALFGVTTFESGSLKISGKTVVIKSVFQAKKLGLGYVTENRKEEGLFLDESITNNIVYNNLVTLSKFGFVDAEESTKLVDTAVNEVSIKATSMKQKINQLSGGNQQKVVLAKWLATHPYILILDEPTRGIDVKSKKQIYDLIFRLKEQNYGVILVSSELVELLGVTDRIYVLREGQLMKELQNNNIKDEDVMVHMMGGVEYARS